MSKTLPLERSYAFAAKIQSARGTDAVPTMADDAVRLAESFVPTEEWISDNKADGEQTGGKGRYPSGAKAGRIFRYPVKRRVRGIGVAYADAPATLPEEHPYLMAVLGAYAVDLTVGAEKVTYTEADTGEALLTVLAQSLGQQFKALDCVPESASLQWEAGKFLDLLVTLMGVGSVPTQQALESATLDTVQPPAFKAGTFTLNGVAVTPIKGSLDFGLSAGEPILDGTAGDAWAGSVLTDRMPKGTMEIQIEDLATFNPYALEAASTPMPWVMDMGGSAYRNVRIEHDSLEIDRVREVNRGGVKAWSLEYSLNRGSTGLQVIFNKE